MAYFIKLRNSRTVFIFYFYGFKFFSRISSKKFTGSIDLVIFEV